MELVRKSEHTWVFVHDEPGAGNACHAYSVHPTSRQNPADDYQENEYLNRIDFQNGPIQERGVNGVQNEDLLAIVIHRLQGFQAGNFACRENAIALTKIQEAMMWLEKRTADRKARGVEGKSEK